MDTIDSYKRQTKNFLKAELWWKRPSFLSQFCTFQILYLSLSLYSVSSNFLHNLWYIISFQTKLFYNSNFSIPVCAVNTVIPLVTKQGRIKHQKSITVLLLCWNFLHLPSNGNCMNALFFYINIFYKFRQQ